MLYSLSLLDAPYALHFRFKDSKFFKPVVEHSVVYFSIRFTMVDYAFSPPPCALSPKRKMTLSKRQYAAKRRKSDAEYAEESRKRQEVLDELRIDPLSNRTALSERFGVHRRTVIRIAAALVKNDTDGLAKLINVRDNRPGQSLTLSLDEEAMICDRIRYCAARGFPIYEDELPEILGKIADDGRPGYVNGMPTLETVRMFRARNSDRITLRKGQK